MSSRQTAEADLVSSGLLGSIKGRICRSHQFVASGALFGKSGGSGADGNGAGDAGERPTFHQLPQFLSDPHGLAGVGLGQEDAEFFASVTAHDVDLAELLVK